VGEEITLEEKIVWCSLCCRVKFPTEVASNAGSFPRPGSGPGFLVEAKMKMEAKDSPSVG
jgi:hypothetical protein